MLEENEISESESLREIAKNMGIKVGNTQDVAKLKAMIAEKNEPAEEEVKPVVSARRAQQIKREEARKVSMKLVRIRLTPMAPFERQLPGTYIDVGNDLVGKVKRYIQFNEPWHVEQIILDALKDKKFRQQKKTRDPQTRRDVYTNAFYPSYGIEVLPDLTETELKELAASQAARHAID